MSSVARDSFFNAYVHMIVLVGAVLQEMAGWAERCPCHEHLQHKYKKHFPSSVLRREMGAHAADYDSMVCPARGCRAPELAAGEAMSVLRGAFDSSLALLTTKWRGMLSLPDWVFS